MGRQDWRTPPSVFNALSERFGPFELDAAADECNHLCDRWHGVQHGSPLLQGWQCFCVYVNPPFGDIMPWVQKAAAHGGRTVMLTPAYTSSPWFREAIKHAELFLPNRRIQFWHPAEKPGSPDRDTVVWVFGQHRGRAHRVEEISIPDHANEVRRLWSEANGQQSFATGTLL